MSYWTPPLLYQCAACKCCWTSLEGWQRHDCEHGPACHRGSACMGTFGNEASALDKDAVAAVLK